MISVQDSPCILLWGRNGKLLVSAGNTLYLVSSDGAKPVLRISVSNWFWHAVEACGKVFVQKHGGFLW